MTTILEEARHLYALGFAIIWVRPKSKIPVEAGWTTGPRKNWAHLESSYQKGYNVGVRLGEASKIKKRYLAVIDLDVKSKDKKHLLEARKALLTIVRDPKRFPCVRSGRGNGSGHYYALVDKPFRTFKPKGLSSPEKVKVFMPSVPVPAQLGSLTMEEARRGFRLRPAWEIGLMCEGSQVVLPPSLHPDSGDSYRWIRPFRVKTPVLQQPTRESTASKGLSVVTESLQDFTVSTVELAWLPISEPLRKTIISGEGVSDRSAALLQVWKGLLSAGLSTNEILTVLTDHSNKLSACAYDHAMTASRKRAAAWLWSYTGVTVEREKKEGLETFQKIPLPPPVEVAPDWREDLVKGKNGCISKLLQNVFLILSNAAAAPVVQRDEFSYRDFYTCKTPWGGKENAVLSDEDTDEAQLWLGRTYQFEPPKNLIQSAFTVMARQNAFDPVRDFFDALPQWDNVPRLDTWLANYFGATGDPEYLAQVFRKWMVAMVMRIYHPGAKFDWMPIFEGAQGVGKSSFGRLLVGENYFLDWLPNLHDKDSALSLQGRWCVEMSELSQFRRNELETIKAFITRTVDKIRPPFGKRLIECARRCVFFGTTNRDTYLIDETGNRRFKPVEVGQLDFKALKKDRIQLFAEAKSLFLEKRETETSLELTGIARIFEKQIHQEKMVSDDSNSMEELMLNFIEKIEKKEIEFNLKKFQLIDLFRGDRPLGGWRISDTNSKFAAKMLRRIGAKVGPIHGRRYWKLEKKGSF